MLSLSFCVIGAWERLLRVSIPPLAQVDYLIALMDHASSALRGIPPNHLQVYLARQNGDWLVADSDVVKELMLGNASSLGQAKSVHILVRVRDPPPVLGKHPRDVLETKIPKEEILEVKFAVLGGLHYTVHSLLIKKTLCVVDLLYLLKSRLYEADVSIRASAITLYLARDSTGEWLSTEHFDGKLASSTSPQSWFEVKLDPEQTIGNVLQSPQPGKINVLLQPPLSFTLQTMHSQLFTKSYRFTAEGLKDAAEVDALVDTIHEFQRLEQHSTPFIVLESSMEMGKTQMAFNLMARDDVDVFYIVCEEEKDDVGTAFFQISQSFMRCVEIDLPFVGDGKVSEISQQNELYTYSFIYAVLGGVPALSGTRTRDEVFQAKREYVGCPVFFLDEFPHLIEGLSINKRKKNIRRCRFVRNIFRSFGLTVIVSATNGAAANVLNLTDPSEPKELSCVIFPTLPRFKSSDPMVLSRLPHILAKIINRSRPLLAKQALEYIGANKVDENTHLDTYMDLMMKTLSAKWDKHRAADYFFHVGQVRLFYGSSYRPRSDLAGQVRSHFSRPAVTTPSRLRLDSSGVLVDGQNDPWTCSIVVPNLDDDPLLHFIFMGGADFHAFADAFGSPIPFCQAVLRGPGFASSGESWSESLEEFVAGGIVAASRHNGFAGLKNSDFERFLSAVMYELGLKAERHIRHQFPEVLEQALSQLSLSVPTLLPLDMELPQLLRTSQLKFGTLKRVQTENPGFGFIDGKVFVECASNRDEDEEFVKTVGHAPPDSIVHIIIVSSLERSYFEDGSSDDVDALASEISALSYATSSLVIFIGSTQDIKVVHAYGDGIETKNPLSKYRTPSDPKATKVIIFLELPS
ncbi:hypothetical protein GN958_ATG19270 [Phytophthora infestans]|uniref:Crinkler (CRN) family protein n=1 Tax=Phytophthora infestans TaxID=4787 RepID=A0A8S9TRJ9_PHYIN|nr:hypothetical protein GN958_ATG19270 [Phytophthora infestans]